MIPVTLCSGRGEFLLSLAIVALCWWIWPGQFAFVWAGGLVIAWAMIITPGYPPLGNVFLLAVVVALFSEGSPLALITMSLGFILVEVFVANREWKAAGAAATMLAVFFLLGEFSCGVVGSTEIAVGAVAAGCGVASLVGVLQARCLQLSVRMAATTTAAETSVRLKIARELHMGVGDSLTRLVVAAEDAHPDVAREARRAALRLRETLRDLKTPTPMHSTTDLVVEVREGVASLRKAELHVSTQGINGRCDVNPLVAVVARELLTNAVKYAESEAQITLETTSAGGVLLVCNDVKTPRPAELQGG
ncbi:hypothetical protein [Corynebacterium pilosum]|uniref:Histidine kinase n=1 Tax=Corynebacterium pilosum TaxID=35756 RepID=A0A376CMR0_9CORY|nr:hypothetical protein [Corynebacterium pilosum]STC69575.1 Uncharacterised protein [Corynebacterium pilosum]